MRQIHDNGAKALALVAKLLALRLGCGRRIRTVSSGNDPDELPLLHHRDISVELYHCYRLQPCVRLKYKIEAKSIFKVHTPI